MILSPKIMVEKKVVYSPLSILPTQIQCNGVDVRIKRVFTLGGKFSYGKKSDNLSFAPLDSFRRIEILPDNDEFFHFNPHIPYDIECFEKVKIPENVAAVVYGRSTFNRRGIFLRSSFYDSGFCNNIGITMYPWIRCCIKKESRIAQIVFFEANSHELYDGQYQGV